MPPQDETHVVISRIDAPFPEEWRVGMEEFTREIGAIKELLGVMSISEVESAEAQKALVNMYTKEEFAKRASQAILDEQPQARVLDQFGKPVAASQAYTPAGAPYSPYSPSPPPASPPPPAGPTPKEYYHSPEPPPGSPYYEEENPSRPPDAEPPESILDKEISMPQHYGGKYTAQDMLILAGKLARSKGLESQGYEKFTGQVPNIEAGYNLVKTYGNAARGMSEGLQSYSTSMGNQPGMGGLSGMTNIGLGPLGNFRLPFNSGAIAGLLGQGGIGSAFSTAMQTPGLSTGEAMSMQQALAEKGYYPGEKGFNEIFGAQTKLFEKGGVMQEMAANPDVMEMMDKGFRTGSASIKEITEMVEEIPEAAKTAHVGMTQMVADMKTYGELAESQGGTIFGGSQQALQLAQATGQPASASLGMINNPWAQSLIYRETGTPSYMQGTLPPQVKNRYATQALQSARQLVGHYKAKHTYNPVSGTFETTSAVSQEAAAIKALVPGYENMSTEQIERHLRGGGTLAGSEENREQTLGATKQWKDDAEKMLKENPNNPAINNFVSGGEEGQGKGAFGHILSQMRNQMTADGRHRYSQEDIKAIREAGQGLHGDELIEAKYKAINNIIEEKASKQSRNQEGEQVTIGLSPAARNFLTVESRRARAKREAGAGGSEPVNHSFTGPTDPLKPNVVNPNEYRQFGSGLQGGGGK
jgi:hypothetical protein